MKILLVLAQGFEDLEAVSVMDVFGWTQYREWVPTVNVVTCGFRRSVDSRFGLHVDVDLLIDKVNVQDFAGLAIPGGFHSHGFDEAYDERLRKLARDFHDRGAPIAAYCVGVLPVAEAGLLKGRRAVSYPFSKNHDNLGRLRELGAEVPEASWAEDGGIISCAGPGGALQVTMRLLELVVGADHAKEVRRLMVYEEAFSPRR